MNVRFLESGPPIDRSITSSETGFMTNIERQPMTGKKTWNMLGAMVPVLVGNVSFAKSKWKTCSLGVYMNQIDSTVNTNKNLMKINEVKKTHARM